MIREAKEDDIDNIIRLHINSFGSNHFSIVFTKRMLKRYFELLISMNEFNFVLFNDTNDTLLGYIIAGFKSQEAVNKFTKEYFWHLVVSLLGNPKFIVEKVIELLSKRKKQNELKAKCRLYLIGVNDKYKGKGIGKTLVNHLEEQLKKKGIIMYGLSVRKDNVEAIRFYNKSGYTIEREDAKSIYFMRKS